MRALGALLCLSHAAAYVPALRRARARTARAAEVLNGDEAALYALGSTVARQLANLDCLSACELDRVFAGAKDALLRTEPRCDVERHLQRGMELHDARLRAKAGMVATAGARALDAAAAAPGAIRTESGLVYHELAAGDGARPSPADSVLLHYHGTLCNGGAGEEGVVFYHHAAGAIITLQELEEGEVLFGDCPFMPPPAVAAIPCHHRLRLSGRRAARAAAALLTTHTP